MNIMILFVAVAAALCVWYLLLRRLTAKPWLEAGPTEGDERRRDPEVAFKLGLWVFMAVVTSLFALFATAYGMRMQSGDWRPLAEPGILWFNTLCLMLASVAMQAAVRGVHRDAPGLFRTGLLGGGLLALLFLAGQWYAWLQLQASGHGMRANPADAFFYLLTGLHGLHLLGGLWVWARASTQLLGGAPAEDIRLRVELCAHYWHYLLLLWLLLFALLLST